MMNAIEAAGVLTLNSAKTYAEGQASTAEQNAKDYADEKAGTAEQNAKAYADSGDASILQSAQKYTDTAIQTSITNVLNKSY